MTNEEPAYDGPPHFVALLGFLYGLYGRRGSEADLGKFELRNWGMGAGFGDTSPVTNLLTISNAGNLVVLSNAAPVQEAPKTPVIEGGDAPFSTPAWMAKIVMVSNSSPMVVKSNGNEYVVMYSRTIAFGPWLWPAVGLLGILVLWIVWSNRRRRME